MSSDVIVVFVTIMFYNDEDNMNLILFESRSLECGSNQIEIHGVNKDDPSC